MKTREQLKEQHDKLISVYEEVNELLRGYPNVVNIGIGLKEKDGKLTDEGCIKIIVTEKKNEADLDPDKIIPKEVKGIKTDIIIEEKKFLQAICEEDQNNYRPIKGGIMVNNVRNGGGAGGSGTLGCLAQLDSDNSWVILSNNHVLYGATGNNGDEIGQPWVGCSWCCKTNVIAKNIDKDAAFDCAIAKVNEDISINNIIEEIGDIKGAGATAAVNGERVRKRGARTGLTSGDISFIDPDTLEITVTPRPVGGNSDSDPGGCDNYESGVTVFSYYGDSGSVYVNDDNEVVGLHYAGNSDASRSYGNDILQVQIKLSITIKPTSSSSGNNQSFTGMSKDLLNETTWTDHFNIELKKTHTGRTFLEIFRKHEVELFNLVNNHRPVTLTWQRKQGPAFLAAFGRSVKYSDYEIPDEINRVTLQNLLMSMSSVLEEHGSYDLRQDIRKHTLDVLQLSKRCKSANEFLDMMEELDKQNTILSSTNY